MSEYLDVGLLTNIYIIIRKSSKTVDFHHKEIHCTSISTLIIYQLCIWLCGGLPNGQVWGAVSLMVKYGGGLSNGQVWGAVCLMVKYGGGRSA